MLVVPSDPNAESTATLKSSAACDLILSRAEIVLESNEAVDSVVLDWSAATDSSKIMLAMVTIESDACDGF